MKFELNRDFNINIDDIDTTFDFYKNISKAIEIMQIQEKGEAGE